LPAGGVVTHSWTISGNGQIVGPIDGASVQVLAGAVAGSYTLTDNTTRDGCPGVCSITVQVINSPIILDCPGDINATTICNVTAEVAQAAIDAQFNAWLNSFGFTGGTNATVVRTPTNPTAPLFTGGSTAVTWTVTGDCETATCSAIFTVVNPCAIICDATDFDLKCFGDTNGQIAATASNGTPPYLFSLFKGGSFVTSLPSPVSPANVIFTNLAAGNDYLVIVTDAVTTDPNAGCLAPAVITQPEFALDLTSLTHEDELCEGSNTGTITATITGGTPPYQIRLDNGALVAVVGTSHTFQNVSAGAHTVTVYDANFDFNTNSGAGCTDSDVEEVGTIPCENAFCTFTQGAFGSAGGLMCDGTTGGLTTLAYIQNAIANAGGSITIGQAGHSILVNNAQCTIDVMPGGGPAKELPAGDFGICSLPSSLLKNGRINNVLVGQTIALSLGVSGSNPANLDDFALQAGTFATADVEGGCGSDDAVQRICNYNPLPPFNLISVTNEYKYRTIPQSVIDAMNPDTVAGLLALANAALANADGIVGSENGATLSAISGAVAAINEGFDECRVFIGWDVPACAPTDPNAPSAKMAVTSPDNTISSNVFIKAYPNPFRNHVDFEITSDISANGSLQIYNLLGQRVYDVYSGRFEAGMHTLGFDNPKVMGSGTYIYVLTIGDKTYTGKLINME
jgi:hypothetical protein